MHTGAFETAPSPSPSPIQPQSTLPSSPVFNGTQKKISISPNTLSPPTEAIKPSGRAISPTPSTGLCSTGLCSTPIQSSLFVTADWDYDWDKTKPMATTPNALSPAPSATLITKEDKAAEMARRKEERKQASFLSTDFLFELYDNFSLSVLRC